MSGSGAGPRRNRATNHGRALESRAQASTEWSRPDGLDAHGGCVDRHCGPVSRVGCDRERCWTIVCCASGAQASGALTPNPRSVQPQMIAAHLTPAVPGTSPACTSPKPVMTSQDLHCYTPQQIRAAYDVNVALPNGSANYGKGQTIVLVDAYGSPTMASDLQFFRDAFFKSLPAQTSTRSIRTGRRTTATTPRATGSRARAPPQGGRRGRSSMSSGPTRRRWPTSCCSLFRPRRPRASRASRT